MRDPEELTPAERAEIIDAAIRLRGEISATKAILRELADRRTERTPCVQKSIATRASRDLFDRAVRAVRGGRYAEFVRAEKARQPL